MCHERKKEANVISTGWNRRKALGSALLAAALLFSVWSVATAPEADAGCGSKRVVWTSSQAWRLAYSFKRARWERIKASWGPLSTVSRRGTCKDVNIMNLNRSTDVRGMYYSWRFRRWIHGTREWVRGPKRTYVVVISNITNGAVFRPAARHSWTKQIAMT